MGRVQRQGVPPTSGGPTPAQQPPAAPVTATNCTPVQIAELNNRLTEARQWVNDAEAKIAQFAAGTAPQPVAWIVHSALQDNFHYSTPDHLASIAANFASLRANLNASFSYECVTQDWCAPDHMAYVRGRYAWMRRLRDINVCPLWFSCNSPMSRVTALIHERAHQYPGAWDYAYVWDAAYATLPTATAIDNTDCYAISARQIFHGGLYGPATGYPC
jgi:hypothetical protein